jgi:hypothetical protein
MLRQNLSGKGSVSASSLTTWKRQAKDRDALSDEVLSMASTLPSQISPIDLWLPQICEALLRADPDILAIVQFGSSVYAPELALDLDLLVITQRKKDDGVYWNAVWSAGQPFWVDVVVVEAGKPLGFLSAAVRAFGRLVFGDEEVVRGVTKEMPVPTFDEARQVLEVGRTYLQIATQEPNPVRREAHYRNAFNALFDAARLAVMAFLLTEETRWGVLADRLPDPFDQRFRAIIHDLHVAIFYRRELPLDVEAEFERQRQWVAQFISDLEAASTHAITGHHRTPIQMEVIRFQVRDLRKAESRTP